MASSDLKVDGAYFINVLGTQKNMTNLIGREEAYIIFHILYFKCGI